MGEYRQILVGEEWVRMRKEVHDEILELGISEPLCAAEQVVADQAEGPEWDLPPLRGINGKGAWD